MKTRLLLILATLLMACSTSNDERIIPIIDYKNSDPPIDNINDHKDKDFKIYRIDEAINISIYRTEDAQLKEYKFFNSPIGDTTQTLNFDKATYKWINDSTIIFKIFNHISKDTLIYKMVANNNRTSVTRL